MAAQPGENRKVWISLEALEFTFVHPNLFWSLTGAGVRDLWPSSNWKALLKALSVSKKMFYVKNRKYLLSDDTITLELSIHCNFDANIKVQCQDKKRATHLKIETCLLILQSCCLWKLVDSRAQDPCSPSLSSCLVETASGSHHLQLTWLEHGNCSVLVQNHQI